MRYLTWIPQEWKKRVDGRNLKVVVEGAKVSVGDGKW
jgi:hypothetical protein